MLKNHVEIIFFDILRQDPNEDTEWNDVLRQKGILPPKPKEKEISEDDIVNMLEQTIKEKQNSEYDESLQLL